MRLTTKMFALLIRAALPDYTNIPIHGVLAVLIEQRTPLGVLQMSFGDLQSYAPQALAVFRGDSKRRWAGRVLSYQLQMVYASGLQRHEFIADEDLSTYLERE